MKSGSAPFDNTVNFSAIDFRKQAVAAAIFYER
jgi:hypothetical protein